MLACSRAVMSSCQRIMIMLSGLSLPLWVVCPCLFVSVICTKLCIPNNQLVSAACPDF
jgi:hypothetical protein